MTREKLRDTGILADEHIEYQYIEPRLVIVCMGKHIKTVDLLDDVLTDITRNIVIDEIDMYVNDKINAEDERWVKYIK